MQCGCEWEYYYLDGRPLEDVLNDWLIKNGYGKQLEICENRSYEFSNGHNYVDIYLILKKIKTANTLDKLVNYVRTIDEDIKCFKQVLNIWGLPDSDPILVKYDYSYNYDHYDYFHDQ
jgi:hypothetical protein